MSFHDSAAVETAFTGFYRVLLGFNWYLAVKAQLSRFKAISMQWHGRFMVFTGFYWVLLDFTVFQLVFGRKGAVAAF